MRDFKGMKRQRGRNRSTGGSQGGGGKPQQNANRAFDSNGPEGVKVRGHAQSVYEKYLQLARDAFSSGDRVLAENHLQHAEHYFRLLRVIQPQRPMSEIVARDVFASGLDIDFEDESGEGLDASGEGEGPPAESGFENGQDRGGQERNGQDRGENGQDRYRQDGQRNNDRYDRDRRDRYPADRQQDGADRQGDRYANDRAQGDRQQGERQQGERSYGDRGQNDRFANDRGQQDRAQADRPQGEGRNRRDRYDNNRGERPREDRPYNREDRGDRYARDDRGYGARTESAAAEAQPTDEAVVIRPQVEAPPVSQDYTAPEYGAESEAGSPILRSQDGGVSEAPAFLQAAPTPPFDEDQPRRRPRTRRRASGVDASEGGAAPQDAPESEEV